MKIIRPVFVLFSLVISIYSLPASEDTGLSVRDGKIIYHPDPRGNRVLDFSYCGYKLSEASIPLPDARVSVLWQKEDASDIIQKAIDYVSSLKPDVDGFRGSVMLDSGTFVIAKALRLHTSGVVLRGDAILRTTLVKKGYDRGAAIYMEGRGGIDIQRKGEIADSYVPAGAMSFTVSGGMGLKPGDRIMIVRPSATSWIADLKCDEYGGGISALGWKPGDVDMRWDRTVLSVDGDKISIDAPVPMALDKKYGKTQVMSYAFPGRVFDCGVEYLTLRSEYDLRYPMDEDHAWTGISIDKAENCWVRKVNFEHFAGSAVIVLPSASRVTVEDCISRAPVSEYGGMRRMTFYTMGQLTLFQRCYSEEGIHDFAAGYIAPGPNAFVQCRAERSNGFSGSVGSWAPGLLFDIVEIDGNNLTFKNLGQAKNGTGWNTANSLFWQCSAAEIECFSPADDAVNRAYGCWAQFSGDGKWEESNNHVQPRSFFYAQLEDRLKTDLTSRAYILPVNTNASSSPTVDVAMQLAEEAKKPKMTLDKWISEAVPNDISVSQSKVPDVHRIKSPRVVEKRSPVPEFRVVKGKLLCGNMLMTGYKADVQWWSGKLRTPYLEKSKIHITRFVPGMEGDGLTDRIDSVVVRMDEQHILALDHNYGLWYDRRRDDHERIRRRDGDVWAPFYEQPFGRSGEGIAWDGLSKYDLTRPDNWYWYRLKTFADKAAESGKLLYYEHFFQHNILEAGAHWVDCPWRTANNINHTGFPEPVNFAGDKRVFMADMFYDVKHEGRTALYRNYIRQSLNAFADNPNVIHLISAEFTGPLHFVQFWLDEIAAWEKETGKHPLVALSVTKDVQDAVLADSARAAVVDIIDIRYWHYRDDGTAYAPEGGLNLAPRQHARLEKPGKVTFESAYRAVKEYRAAFPDKVVTYYGQSYPEVAWAVLMAGGSCPALLMNDNIFLRDVAGMNIGEVKSGNYVQLVNPDTGIIIFSYRESEIPIPLLQGKYVVKQINPANGDIKIINSQIKGGGVFSLNAREGVYWVQKK